MTADSGKMLCRAHHCMIVSCRAHGCIFLSFLLKRQKITTVGSERQKITTVGSEQPENITFHGKRQKKSAMGRSVPKRWAQVDFTADVGLKGVSGPSTGIDKPCTESSAGAQRRFRRRATPAKRGIGPVCWPTEVGGTAGRLRAACRTHGCAPSSREGGGRDDGAHLRPCARHSALVPADGCASCQAHVC